MLEGLEITILNKSELENQFTIGAEFYSKIFVKKINNIKKSSYKIYNLKELSNIITDGDHGAPNYQNSGILYLLSESIKEGYIDKNIHRYITKELHNELKRSSLKSGDVVVTKTGIYFGKSAVIPKNFPESNTSAHVGKISVKKDLINPYYLSTFLNSTFGYSQLRRRGIKATRPEIKLIEFDDIKVCIPSKFFQEKIQESIEYGIKLRLQSQQTYTQAENLLLETLGLKNFTPSKEKVNIKNFKDSFLSSGRLDAEYYQPKYEDYISLIKKYKNGYKKLSDICNLKDNNFKPQDKTKYKYIELSNVGKSGDINGCTNACGVELPSRAKRKVSKGDVIVSSIEGSLDSCAIITEDYDDSICSTGFYVVNSEELNSETLLVLFKSGPMQNILKQNCSGTILTAINKNEFLQIPLPVIEENIQQQISKKIEESFKLKKQSEQLLELAKTAVEIAVEDDEEMAMEFIKEEMGTLNK